MWQPRDWGGDFLPAFIILVVTAREKVLKWCRQHLATSPKTTSVRHFNTFKYILIHCSVLPPLRYTNRTLNLRLSQLPPVPLDGLNLVAGRGVQPPDDGVTAAQKNCQSTRDLRCTQPKAMHQLKVATRSANWSKLENRHQTKLHFGKQKWYTTHIWTLTRHVWTTPRRKTHIASNPGSGYLSQFLVPKDFAPLPKHVFLVRLASMKTRDLSHRHCFAIHCQCAGFWGAKPCATTAAVRT